MATRKPRPFYVDGICLAHVQMDEGVPEIYVNPFIDDLNGRDAIRWEAWHAKAQRWQAVKRAASEGREER